MADSVTVDNLQANSVNTTDLNAGNMLVTGPARFVNGIYTSEIKGSQDINKVTSGATISDSAYVLISDGTHLSRIKFSDLCTAIFAKFDARDKTYLTVE